MRAVLYARVLTHEQQALGLTDTLMAYIKERGWDLMKQIKDIPGGGRSPTWWLPGAS
jgi:hypothetical protein